MTCVMLTEVSTYGIIGDVCIRFLLTIKKVTFALNKAIFV